MKDGFIRVGAASPELRVCDVWGNLDACLDVAGEAAKGGVSILLFPELTLTSATAGDLYRQRALTDAALSALSEYLEKTKDLPLCSLIGLPVRLGSAVYNAMALCYGGEVLAIIPKRYVSASSPFSPAPDGVIDISFLGASVPFGADIAISVPPIGELRGAVVFFDELISAYSDASELCSLGVNLIFAPAATPVTALGRAKEHMIMRSEAERLSSCVVYANASSGESGTDAVYFGDTMILECERVLAEGGEDGNSRLAVSEVDFERISAIRLERDLPTDEGDIDTVSVDIECTEVSLSSPPSRMPFVSSDPMQRWTMSKRVIELQATALAGRVKRSHSHAMVLGVSGGLDSTMALVVAVRAREMLGEGYSVLGLTMPCFGTSSGTRTNAELLCEALSVPLRTVDIKAAVTRHLQDIGHPEDLFDAAYENAQARERTQVLMDVANSEGGIVVGTGDLSELALGFATYNGDHMSMYGVNASIPKTLMRVVLADYAERMRRAGREDIFGVIVNILNTPISPELLPTDKDGAIAQCTEEIVGEYALHDFFIYNALKWGFTPKKIYRLAKASFEGVYEPSYILDTLKTFIKRFFASQFKRSCLPDGPRVSEVSLSPRGAWSMPSDAVADVWLKSLDEIAE